MKIFISADIEGITGVANWDETTIGQPGYEYARTQMVQEINACCLALIEEGVEEIFVKDAHDTAHNIFPSDLLPNVTLIRGWMGTPWDMIDGLDRSFDGVIFIGYHSPARSSGSPISHTLFPELNHIKINNKIVSEFILNAYYAKTLGVPVIMVSGDDNLTKIVHNENSEIITVSTQIGVHGAVYCKDSLTVLKEIKAKTKLAIKQLKEKEKNDLFVILPKTLEVEIHFRLHQQAHTASFYPGARLLSDDKTLFVANNILDVLKFILFTTK